MYIFSLCKIPNYSFFKCYNESFYRFSAVKIELLVENRDNINVLTIFLGLLKFFFGYFMASNL